MKTGEPKYELIRSEKPGPTPKREPQPIRVPGVAVVTVMLPTLALIAYQFIYPSVKYLFQKQLTKGDKNYREKDQEDEDNDESNSFFVTPCFVRHGLELKQKVVATRSLPDLDNRICQYMIGEVVGIINEAQHIILLKMLPNERFDYDPKIEFTTSFVCLSDFQGLQETLKK